MHPQAEQESTVGHVFAERVRFGVIFSSFRPSFEGDDYKKVVDFFHEKTYTPRQNPGHAYVYIHLTIKYLGSIWRRCRCRRSFQSGRCIWTDERTDVWSLRCRQSPSSFLSRRRVSRRELRSTSRARTPCMSPARHTPTSNHRSVLSK